MYQYIPRLTWIQKINTSTIVTCHNFDDLDRQCYWVWANMTSITV